MNLFSLIVATLNRVDELNRLIESLVRQTYVNFEVIVIDQSDIDNFEVNAVNLKKLTTIGVNYKHIKLSTKGLSRARNVGLKNVKGNIISFPDDDCWYEVDILHKVNCLISKDFDFISGYYSEPLTVNDSFPGRDLLINNYKCSQIPSSVTIFVKTEAVIKNQIIFDELLGAGTSMPIGEETDFIIKLISSGCVGFYYKNLCIYHKLSIGNVPSIDKRVLEEKSRGYVHGKNFYSLWICFYCIMAIFKMLGLFFIGKTKLVYLIGRLKGIRMGLLKQ